jgi:hypothetical protein
MKVEKMIISGSATSNDHFSAGVTGDLLTDPLRRRVADQVAAVSLDAVLTEGEVHNVGSRP